MATSGPNAGIIGPTTERTGEVGTSPLPGIATSAETSQQINQLTDL